MHIRQIRGWLVRLFGFFNRTRREREFAEELETIWPFTLKTTCAPECRRKRRDEQQRWIR